MPEIRFSLSLNPDQLLRYYRGRSRLLQVVADDGRKLRFPIEKLRPFVSPAGVHGRFLLRYDSGGRFTELSRI